MKFIRTSFIWAALVAAGITIYIGTGNKAAEQQAIADAEQEEKLAAAEKEAQKLQSVEVQKIAAQMQTATLTVPAQSEILDRVQIAAETGGIVIERPVSKGDKVQKGDLLCKIDMGTRLSDLAQAQAGLAQAEIDFNSAQKLVKLGHAAKVQEVARKAQLDAAKASVKRAEKDIERVEIHAPFDGIVEEIPAEVGALLSPGQQCATISNTEKMLIVGNISERDIGRIKLGLDAHVKLVSGEEFEGKLTFIAAAANPRTRTFRVDVSVDNPENIIRDGMTSEISIQLEKNEAHFIKKSLLTLDADGTIGVRIINADNVVEFHNVDILSDKKDGVWVAGLPTDINLITIGHEYVIAGQKVDPSFAGAE